MDKSLPIIAVILPNRNFTVTVGREFMNTAYSWGGNALERVASGSEALNARVASIGISPAGAIWVQFETRQPREGEKELVPLRPSLVIMNEPHLILYGYAEKEERTAKNEGEKEGEAK